MPTDEHKGVVQSGILVVDECPPARSGSRPARAPSAPQRRPGSSWGSRQAQPAAVCAGSHCSGTTAGRRPGLPDACGSWPRALAERAPAGRPAGGGHPARRCPQGCGPSRRRGTRRGPDGHDAEWYTKPVTDAEVRGFVDRRAPHRVVRPPGCDAPRRWGCGGTTLTSTTTSSRSGRRSCDPEATQCSLNRSRADRAGQSPFRRLPWRHSGGSVAGSSRTGCSLGHAGSITASYSRPASGHPWSRALSPSGCSGFCEGAGLTAIRFHDLRHGTASLLVAQGSHPRTIMEVLGHASITITMNTYAHVAPALQREAARSLDAVLRGA